MAVILIDPDHTGHDNSGMMFKVLFLCTGNYYRSRFAEIVFNTWAATVSRPLHSVSRGVAIELGVNNVGPLSQHARQRLAQLKLHHDAAGRFPLQVQERDFEGADLVIALDRQEHLPMMRQRYPAWADRIEYWNVPDVPLATPEEALTAIEQKVRELIDRLSET